VVCMGEMRNAYEVLTGKYVGKRPFERPRIIWKDYSKMVLKEI